MQLPAASALSRALTSQLLLGLRILLLLQPAPAAAARVGPQLQTNALFSDGMVLQTSADKPLSEPTTLHGTAAPGTTVRLSATPAGFPGAPYNTTAAADGTCSSWGAQITRDARK